MWNRKWATAAGVVMTCGGIHAAAAQIVNLWEARYDGPGG